MKYLHDLFASYQDYCAYRKGGLKYAGIVGAVGYPFFHVIYTRILPQPYENLTIRLVASVACILMAAVDCWPSRLRKYHIAYSYAVVLYCLPFFHVFMSLKNHGNLVFIADSFMAVFFLVLLTDWRNTVTMLCVGTGLGVLLYIVTTAHPSVPSNYVARLPTFILVVLGGSLFKFSEKQLQVAQLRVVTALAGSIAHEMRKPLGRVQYSLEMAGRAMPAPTLDPVAQTLSGEQINDLYCNLARGQLAIQRGLQVIAMTLDEVNTRRIDARYFTHIHAVDAVQKALSEYAYETEVEQRIVSMNVSGDFVFWGDETLFVFILFNLFQNAFFYFKLHPDMRITVTVDGATVVVTDTGPGIPKSELPRLFESFHTSGKAGGTGLGLAYCKRAMSAFGGDIVCDSVEGRHTSFTLRFPEATRTAPDTQEQAVTPDTHRSLDGWRVLVVDDDAAQRRVMRRQLSNLGVQVHEAEDGQCALDRIGQERYDLVLMDLHMPVLDGYATTGMIRAGVIPEARAVPILACTAEPPDVSRMKAERAGMSGFVSKPCREADLVRALRACLEHPPADGTSLAGKTAILADDDQFGRRVVRVGLERYGMRVLEAEHGQAVLDLFATSERCDVMLLDLNMPGIGGIETTRAIRATAVSGRRVPIIALTGHSDDAIINSALSAGMDGFITKPVRSEVLANKLLELMRTDTDKLQPVSAMVRATGNTETGQPYDRVGAERADEPLLDGDRIGELRQDGLLDELVGDYLGVLDLLLDRLDASVASNNLDDASETLHSLLGISVNIGGAALRRLLKRLYVPVAQERRWPEEENWPRAIRELAGQTFQLLRQECSP